MSDDKYARALARLDAWDGDGEASVISALLRALLVERQLRETGSCDAYFPGDAADAALDAFVEGA